MTVNTWVVGLVFTLGFFFLLFWLLAPVIWDEHK